MIAMHWATKAIEDLQAGKQAVIHPKGNSMQPKVVSGAEVTLEPVTDPNTLVKGDIVLVSVARNIYLHLVTAVDKNRVQISNNKGHVNGWVMKKDVYGRAVSINNTVK
ncbi:MAG TPA: hypothetical protein VM577_18795 [Anaerovoracaceae bacterium]|nr:hypothetical protein [Anaerovoracaceae bacterium]